MPTIDTLGTAGHYLRTELDRAGVTYEISPGVGALANIFMPDERGNVFIIALPDGAEIRITNDEGTTAYPPDEHTGWVALRYKHPDIAMIHRSTERDIQADSKAVVAAISAHLST